MNFQESGQREVQFASFATDNKLPQLYTVESMIKNHRPFNILQEEGCCVRIRILSYLHKNDFCFQFKSKPLDRSYVHCFFKHPTTVQANTIEGTTRTLH